MKSKSARGKEERERFKKEIDSIYISDYEEKKGIKEEVLEKYYETYPKRNREKDIKDAYSLIYSFAKEEEKNKKYRYILEGIKTGILQGTKTREPLPLIKLRTKGRSIISKLTYRKERKIHPEEEKRERFKKEKRTERWRERENI